MYRNFDIDISYKGGIYSLRSELYSDVYYVSECIIEFKTSNRISEKMPISYNREFYYAVIGYFNRRIYIRNS